MFSKRKQVTFFRRIRNYSKSSSSKELYILSAVRTPITLSNGVLNQFTVPQLFSFAFKEALQRAVIPSEEILNVFLECSSCHDNNEDILKRTGLPKTVKITSTSTCGMRNFIKGVKFLQTNDENVCVVGGAVSGLDYTEKKENNAKTAVELYLSRQTVLEEWFKSDFNNFNNAHENGAFYDEIAKINYRKKGKQIIVTDDELPRNDINFKNMNEPASDFYYTPTFADGATALVIATEDYVQKNNLTPIAQIISFAEESVKFNDFSQSQVLAIEKALELGGCQGSDISQWEIVSVISNMYSNFMNHFKVNSSAVNKHGGALIFGYPIGLSGARALCHLAHSLSFRNLGCVACGDFSETASAVIIKKFYKKPSGTPRLTLFTKKPCPLCDELKEQLKPFERRVSLQEVDIEAEENKKYNELYKYDIPVLFLEGRFLCKHKLEPQHLNRRLSEFENFK